MGQQEIYNFLKRNKTKWFTAKEICKRMDISIGSGTNCLQKLRKSDFIGFKESPARREAYLYRFRK